MSAPSTPVGPVVVLGGGYAGLTVAHEVHRRSRGEIPVVLIDRAPVHVLRTELYEVSELAAAGNDPDHWAIPLQRIFERTNVTCRTADVLGIDLAARSVQLSGGESQSFGTLVIGLGSVASYYHVPGAETFTHSVYGLAAARKLARALREVARTSASLPGERRPRVVVVGGGSTGTELAAEVATADWGALLGAPVRPFDVILVTGTLPFLAGLPERLVRHARDLLRKAGVSVIHGINVREVAADRLFLEDGTVLTAEIIVWCAGLEAPPIVRGLPVAHGRAGRIAVAPTLEVPGHPGVFAVGDVIELTDPASGVLVPGTAQAALAEARWAARNIVAARAGRPLLPFRYRERSSVVAVGRGRGAAALRHGSLWGTPAGLLKRLVEWEYARSIEGGSAPPGVM